MVGLPLYSIRLELQNIGEKSKEDYFLRADDAAVCAELERRQQIQLKRTNDGSGQKRERIGTPMMMIMSTVTWTTMVNMTQRR